MLSHNIILCDEGTILMFLGCFEHISAALQWGLYFSVSLHRYFFDGPGQNEWNAVVFFSSVELMSLSLLLSQCFSCCALQPSSGICWSNSSQLKVKLSILIVRLVHLTSRLNNNTHFFSFNYHDLGVLEPCEVVIHYFSGICVIYYQNQYIM